MPFSWATTESMRDSAARRAVIFAVLLATVTIASVDARGAREIAGLPGTQPKTVAITEVMSRNSGYEYDILGYSPDWIELYNYGEEPVSLEGYGVSDNVDILFRQRLEGVELEPGEAVRFWAVGTGVPGVDLPRESPHPNDATTADLRYYLSFRVDGDGEWLFLTHPDGTIVDALEVPELPDNVTYGRLTADLEATAVLTDPTPGSCTEQVARLSDAQAVAPEFSQVPGFYTDRFELSITGAEPGATIYYTLDGSVPDRSSARYDDPIVIDDRSGEPNRLATISGQSFSPRPVRGTGCTGTVVRAVAYVDGHPRSDVITGTWFVTPQGRERYTMPVISIVFEEEDLFSYDHGIYVLGRVFDEWRESNRDAEIQGDTPANYNQRGRGWSVPVSVELFETDSAEETVGAAARMRTLGGWSRANPIKPLRLDFESPLEHQVFPDLEIDRYSSLVLRTSANDWETVLFRDAFMTWLMRDLIEVQASRPAIVFFNGEYWGIHNIRERVTTDYFESHFGIPEENILVLQNWDEVAEGTPRERTSYGEMMEFVMNNDCSIPANFRHVESVIDVENYINYMAAQIYFGNHDWPGNNVRFWQDAVSDSQWRWILYDTDFGFGLYAGEAGHLLNTIQLVLAENGPDWPNPPWSTLLFRALFANAEFRDRFLVRMSDFLNSRFRPETVMAEIEMYAAQYRPEIPEHILRWGILWGDAGNWEAQVRRMERFALQRPQAIRAMMSATPFVGRPAALTIAVGDGGSVRLNTIDDVRGQWAGYYFIGTTLSVEAVPDPGYRFIGWSGGPPSGATTTSGVAGGSGTGDAADDQAIAEIEFVIGGATVLAPLFEPAD